MVLKKFKLPGAPTMSNVFVEESGGGGGVELLDPTYNSQTLILTIEKTMAELIDLFNSGKKILIRIPEGLPSWSNPGTYLIFGVDESNNRYTLLSLAFGNGIGMDFNCENLTDYPSVWLGD